MADLDPIDTLVIPIIKVLLVFVGMVLSVPLMVIVERKILGRMQERPGPNRVGVLDLFTLLDTILFKGWLERVMPEAIKNFSRKHLRNGELQALIDGLKLFLKEDLIPPASEKIIFILAPFLALVPAVLTFTIIPFGPEFQITIADKVHTIWLGLTDFPDGHGGVRDLPIGILFYFAITSVGVYGIVLAGWSSNNKYSLLGGIRSTAQLVSYELGLGLSLVGVLLIVGSFSMRDLVASQADGFWMWHIFRQPLGFLMFLIGGFGETNRLPFDLPEGESELGAGFHTEYSSMKFALFFMAEYLNILTFSAVITTLFLGGYHGPFHIDLPPIVAALSGIFWFLVKISAIFFFFVLVRGTLPRLRYDQLMDLGWKVMFPLGVANVIVTAGVIALHLPASGVWLAATGAAMIFIVDRFATTAKRRVLRHAA